MTNVLETIAQEAHSHNRASLRTELRKAKSLSRHIEGLLAHKFYAIEGASRDQIKEARRNNLQRIEELEGRLRPTNAWHPPVSLDALRQFRTKEGWPSIAIFSLNFPTFEIYVRKNAYGTQPNFTPVLPWQLQQCFDDVVERLRKHVIREQKPRGVRLAARFSGLIPADVKVKILKARRLFREIFILAEPLNWSLEDVAKLPRDPLVVGWDGTGLSLIAKFDTTPLEEALLLDTPTSTRQ
jgi:hypothetical protein